MIDYQKLVSVIRSRSLFCHLGLVMDQLNLSTRAYQRIPKLARKIAHLAGPEEIQPVHLAHALQYRPKLMVSYILIHLIR